MTEIVYILTNEAMPGLVKVGRTTGELAKRIRELFTTGVPLPFEVFYACEVGNADLVERKLHDAFDDHRLGRKREFFRIAPERVQSALSLAALREIRIGDEIFETLQDKEDVVAEKRRSRFRLSMINMKIGSELKLASDPTITCSTVDEINQVLFRGEQYSLSAAAQQVTGYPISGSWAWTYEGRRLDDIRREMDEALS